MQKMNKVNDLINYLKQQEKLAIAISGGLDSSILLALAVSVLGKENCLALTAQSPYMMSTEWDECVQFVDSLGVRHITPNFDIPEAIINNPPDRCYLCKTQIFTTLKQLSEQEGFYTLADGSNIDDLNDYRPGHRALKELNIISPFLEANMGKQDIRYLGKRLGLSENLYQKPAYACLLTRLPHNEKIELDRLYIIDQAEMYLRNHGIKACRVRWNDGNVRIEIDPSDFPLLIEDSLREKVLNYFKSLGIKQITLDLSGYKQGNMNQIT